MAVCWRHLHERSASVFHTQHQTHTAAWNRIDDDRIVINIKQLEEQFDYASFQNVEKKYIEYNFKL